MSASTRRLYLEDPFLLDFDARVVAHGDFGGRASLILDESAFYPEAGGQLGDHGALGDVAVLDVQVDDEGRVHHVVEGPLAAVGTAVHGAVDKRRRRVHMALHTGQHLLSQALFRELGADTVSARLGETSCTIDLDQESVSEAGLARAEALVNSIIDDDLPVRAFFPTDEELAALELRRAPKVTHGIRVVEVPGFDVTPCGGTHCVRTAEVGFMRITGLERQKKKVRVLFSSGPRARDELFGYHDLLKRLASSFTSGLPEVEASVDKLRRENKDLKDSLGAMRARLADAVASELAAAVDPAGPFVHALEGEAEFVRRIASVLVGKAPVVLLGARGDDAVNVVAARAEGETFDCGAFVKALCSAAGGRGGGKPDFAQGRLPVDADFEALARAVL